MIHYKRLVSIFFLVCIAMIATAQTSTNSPYSRYGFGQLSDQNFGNSKAMGGIAYGLRDRFQINASNPASYSAVDSLTFLFDAGISLQNANFKENGIKTNAKNSTVDYIAMQFRLCKGLGMTAGFLPYSNVGYNMSRTKQIGYDEYQNPIKYLENFSGEGGLQQVFVGLGYKVFKNLSVGANLSYLYGEILHNASGTFSNTSAYSSSQTDKVSVRSYKLDLGLQFTQQFGSKHVVNIGAVYSNGHELNGTGYKYKETYSNESSYPQSQTGDTIKNAFSIPHTLGLGFTYIYNNRLTVGLDYTMQNWEKVKFFNEKGTFLNRKKIAIGAEYLPNRVGRKYLERVRYRAGVHYSDPYTRVNEHEGAREYGVSFGFGFPLELYNAKSILNISGQYVKVSPKTKGMLEENYLRINIGLTFNERWFMKWKVD